MKLSFDQGHLVRFWLLTSMYGLLCLFIPLAQNSRDKQYLILSSFTTNFITLHDIEVIHIQDRKLYDKGNSILLSERNENFFLSS